MNGIEKTRAFYRREKNAPILMKEFGYYCLDKWKAEGYITDQTDLNRLFGYDEPGVYDLYGLGWCEAAFEPCFPERILEDRGTHEVVQDFAGRKVLYFKGRRNGFMPEYLDHPVKDMRSWEEDVRWRLDPDTPARRQQDAAALSGAREAQAAGKVISQRLVGGYMYLRSLIGPETLLYTFYDDPVLIDACMERWLELADAVIARHQEAVEIDELFFAEDICYNVSSLISQDMIRRFLFPYYEQLIANTRRRKKSGPLYLQVDTDGRIDAVIDLYRSVGFNYFSPFEVAAGSDVVAARKAHPDILISGGIDKRILAAGKEAIDRELDRILPYMKEQGGYIPTCDHGVPEEVAFEDYLYFRERLLAYAT